MKPQKTSTARRINSGARQSHPLKKTHVLGRCVVATSALLSCAFPAFAATQYWDTSTAGGLQSGSGVWNVGSTALWSDVSTGSNPLVTWTDGNDASFQTNGSNTVTINGTVNPVNLNQSLASTSTTISGGIIKLGNTTGSGISLSNGGSLIINSEIQLNGDASSQRRNYFQNSGGTLTINGNIGEAISQETLRINGSTVTLGGTNTFTGGLQVRGSAAGQYVIITNVAATGTGGILFGQSGDTSATYNFAANLAASGTISQNLIFTGGTGNVTTIASNGAGALTLNGTMLFNTQLGISGLRGSTGAVDLRLRGTSTASNTFATAITDSGSGGVTSLTKADAGTWILSGANTYTGATSVTAGTLLINGSLSASSAVTVASGAAVGGSGTIGGTLTVVSGGKVAPGNSPGILSTGSFSLAGGLYAELGKAAPRSGQQPLVGTDYDQVNVSGTVTLSGADLNLTILTGIESQDLYFIVANDGTDAVSGVFASLNGITTNLSQGAIFTSGGQQFVISYTADSAGKTFLGGNDVALMAIPEPSSLLMGAAGLLILAVRARARSKRS